MVSHTCRARLTKFARNYPAVISESIVLGENGATVTGRFYRATGIAHRELVDAVKSASDDVAVAAWLHARLDAETIANWNGSYYHTTIGNIKSPLRERMFIAHPAAEGMPETTPLADMFDADDVAMFGAR